MTQLVDELQALKNRMKATWMAGDYAKIAEVIQPHADEFVARLQLKPGMRVLDAACGTGNLTIPAARTGATVTGQDLTPTLLEVAQQRAAAQGLNIRFDTGDAEELPYADGASFRRGSLLAVLEHGLPVITTMPETGREASRGSNGQREWPELVDGENAVLVLPGDVDGLASAVEKVASDADLRARLAEGAAKVAQFFSWARIAGSHADLYTRLMRSRVDQG